MIINFIWGNGFQSLCTQINDDDHDSDLDVQVENYIELQKRDESEFLGNFDSNDHLAICQAIQCQVSALLDKDN